MSKRGVTTFLKAFNTNAQKFYEMSTDILITLDARGNIIEVNPAFETELGRAKHEVINTPIVYLIHEMDMAKFIRSCSIINGRQPFRLLKKKNGCVEVDMIKISFERILDEDERRGFLTLRPRGEASE